MSQEDQEKGVAVITREDERFCVVKPIDNSALDMIRKMGFVPVRDIDTASKGVENDVVTIVHGFVAALPSDSI